MIFENKHIVVIGGTGSLGQMVVRRLLTGEMGRPATVTVFSRDEAKQQAMRLSYLKRRTATDEVIYQNSQSLLKFRIGDVRDYPAIVQAIQSADAVIYAAALKQVPTCEYFPFEAIQTNVIGAVNVVRAIRETQTSVKLVIGLSTDKACKPINVMGMTKALQERVFIEANLDCPNVRFVCVRYGNVIASRGSVVPLFLDQIAHGGPLTITMKEMTRFLISLDQAVDTIFAAARQAKAGETYIPRIPAARLIDLAEVLIAGRDIPIHYIGIRPGEKVHEILISDEECYRTIERDGYYVIRSMLPELQGEPLGQSVLTEEFSSAKVTLDKNGLRALLVPYLENRFEETHL